MRKLTGLALAATCGALVAGRPAVAQDDKPKASDEKSDLEKRVAELERKLAASEAARKDGTTPAPAPAPAPAPGEKPKEGGPPPAPGTLDDAFYKIDALGKRVD